MCPVFTFLSCDRGSPNSEKINLVLLYAKLYCRLLCCYRERNAQKKEQYSTIRTFIHFVVKSQAS